MQFKRKTLNGFLTLIIIFASLITTGLAIYYFGFKTLKNDRNENLQPVFEQTEINWMTQEKALIFNRFKILSESKRPKIKFNYFVDNFLMPTTIKISYHWQNQIIDWVYELRY